MGRVRKILVIVGITGVGLCLLIGFFGLAMMFLLVAAFAFASARK